MSVELLSIVVLFGVFFLLMFLSVPVSISIGLATIATVLLSLPFDNAMFVSAQKMITALDSFALLALPFFILAGNIMNRGGIAMRLINLALVLAGRLPGALAHCNVIANMLFGSISGSAVAAAAAVGCSVGKVRLTQVIPYMLPMYIAMIITLLLVTFIPKISLFLPQLLMGYGG